MSKNEVSMEDIVSLCKRRGFIYQGSEIYGGLAGTWDYGPLGLSLKRNIMNLWWQMFVEDRDDMYGVDAAILMNQKVWQASGHVDTFADPLVECLGCKTRYRVDQIIDDKEYAAYISQLEELFQEDIRRKLEALDDMQAVAEYLQTTYAEATYKKMVEDTEKFKNIPSLYEEFGKRLSQAKKHVGPVVKYYLNNHIKCPNCGKQTWTLPGMFNMMFETHVGLGFGRKSENITFDDEGNRVPLFPTFGESVEERFYESESISYLRPETAQGIFTNFKNVVDSFYPDLPFGIAQQGKAFRNEISPRDFVFRSREFEQMEIEYFVHPDKWEEAFEHWVQKVHEWCKAIGLPDSKVHELEVPEDDRAHYSKRTIDFEFDYPIGRKELLGLAYRTDFDLGNIQRESGKSMEYTIKGSNEKFVPHVIEPSFGVERAIMAVLVSAYHEEEINGDTRTVLKLPAHLAPYRVAVSPLLKNKPELVDKAREVYTMLKKKYGNVIWDDNGNIGKRYRRQDEIGTPECIVIDFDTLEDDTVTVRDRDTTNQKRVKITDLVDA